jgi:hypothetical protein
MTTITKIPKKRLKQINKDLNSGYAHEFWDFPVFCDVNNCTELTAFLYIIIHQCYNAPNVNFFYNMKDLVEKDVLVD